MKYKLRDTISALRIQFFRGFLMDLRAASSDIDLSAIGGEIISESSIKARLVMH